MCTTQSETREQLRDEIIGALEKSRRHPLTSRELNREIARRIDSQRTGKIEAVLRDLVGSGAVLCFGGKEPAYYWKTNVDHLTARLEEVLKLHHSKHWYEPGMKIAEVKKSFSETQTKNARRNIDPRLFDLALETCRSRASVLEDGGGLRLAGFTQPSDDDPRIEGVIESVTRRLDERRFQKTDLDRLAADLGIDRRLLKNVVSRLTRGGRLVEIDEARHLTSEALEQVAREVTAALHDGRRLRITDFTQLLGQSRSVVVPLMQFLDRRGLTKRDGDFRTLAAGPAEAAARARGAGRAPARTPAGCR